MAKPAFSWENDNDWLTCVFRGNVPEETFWGIQQMFVHLTGLKLGRTILAKTDPARIQIMKRPLPLSLASCESVLRKELDKRISKLLAA